MQLWTAFLLGLAGSLHCAGMCGPLVLALAHSRPATSGGWPGRLVYHLGRVASYCLLGLLAGLVGHLAVPGGSQSWLSIALGLALLVGLAASIQSRLAAPLFKWVGWLQNRIRGLTPRNSLGAQTVLGALNGLLPCGLVYVAAAGATATAHPISSAGYMALFGLGTWPVMLGIHFSGRRIRLPSRLSWSTINRAAVLVMAILLILRGLELGIPLLSPELSTADGGSGRCH